MFAIEIFAIVVSGASVALAIIAIWLTIHFYTESSRISHNIDSNVKKYDEIFNNTLSQLFKMVEENQQRLYKTSRLQHDDVLKRDEIDDEAKEETLKQLIFQTLREESSYSSPYIYNGKEYTTSGYKLYALVANRAPINVLFADFMNTLDKLKKAGLILQSTEKFKMNTGISMRYEDTS